MKGRVRIFLIFPSKTSFKGLVACPGSLAVKTLGFQCRGCRFNP